jgi:arylsulfatase A-like enzyme
MQGRSVVPLLRGEKLPERPLLAEKLYIARVEKKSLRTDRLKLILPVGKRTRGQLRPGEMDPELYDLRRDPDEADDLAKRYPEIVEKMKGGLESLLTGATGGIEETTPEDAQLRKDLEALGYIGG